MYNVAVSDERYGLSDNARQDRWFPGPSPRVLSMKVSSPNTGRGRGPAGRSRPKGWSTRSSACGKRRFTEREFTDSRASVDDRKPGYPHRNEGMLATVHKRPRSVFTADAEGHTSPVPGAHFAAAVDKSRLSIPHVSKELICRYLTDLKLIGALEQ
jgi:hypothetical protein